MTAITLATSDAHRQVAKEPRIALRNRIVEPRPELNDSQASYIARPALKRFAEAGTGPIHSIFDEPGVFGGDMFAWSGEKIYRVDHSSGAPAQIGTVGEPPGNPSWAATAPIGTVPAYLFFCAGRELWCFTENGSAIGTLDITGTISNGDSVEAGGVYYQWTSGSVDTGTPDGSSGNPWLVALGSTNDDAIGNMFNAFNGTGEKGVAYSTALTPNPTVKASGWTAGELYVVAIEAGATGNSITTTSTGANIAWGAGTLAGGGGNQLRQIPVPDDLGAISVAAINSFIVVVPVQDEAVASIGRFHWIEPGETTVADGFYTAERAPDKIHQVAVYGDLFWLLGQTTTEPWQVTGETGDPFRRYPGILYDDGTWQGTALQVGDGLMVINPNGQVDYIAGGRNPVSNPAVEELIRRAIQRAAHLGV